MGKIKAVISLIQISSALERIADHATNIAELVFYIVEGKIIRHKSYEEF
jgi:phosphate transport system protein